jgi:hypothetical protein
MKGYSHDDTASFDTLDNIVLVLMRIAAEANSVVTADACRAVAILLELWSVDDELQNISDGVKKILEWTTTAASPYTGDDNQTTAGTTTDLHSAAEILTQTVEQQCKDIWTLTERLEKEVTAVVLRVEDAVDDARASAPVPGAGAGVTQAVASRTYASAAATSHPPERAAALASTTARTCQILLERAPLTEQWMTGMTDKDMLQKARMATVVMEKSGASTPPNGATFVGATQQRSGAWLLHMNTAAAAVWLKAEMPLFLSAMGGTSSFKDRLMNVVVQFVPVSFEPDQSGSLRAVEGDNPLLRGAFAKAHWIKPVQRRYKGQRVAHAIFGFTDAAAANALIRDGAWVEGSKVYGHKLLTEPVRCLKCQGVGLGHIAATCKSIHEVCARCGEMHRTNTCTVTNERRACANCRIAKMPHRGHGAADRSCPIFQNKLQYSLERNHEAKYPYFLIEDDPSTWVTHEERNGGSAGLGSTPAWKTAQEARRARGPGPPAHVAAPIRARMTPGSNAMREPGQQTLEQTLARAGMSARDSAPVSASVPVQRPEVLGVRMHPARAAQMMNDVVPAGGVGSSDVTPSGSSETGAPGRSSPIAPVQWSAEEEEAMREIEEEEAAATKRLAMVAERKAKFKARQPGPIDFSVTFFDDNTLNPTSAARAAESLVANELPAASDDAVDHEIEMTPAPRMGSIPRREDDTHV